MVIEKTEYGFAHEEGGEHRGQAGLRADPGESGYGVKRQIHRRTKQRGTQEPEPERAHEEATELLVAAENAHLGQKPLDRLANSHSAEAVSHFEYSQARHVSSIFGRIHVPDQ